MQTQYKYSNSHVAFVFDVIIVIVLDDIIEIEYVLEPSKYIVKCTHCVITTTITYKMLLNFDVQSKFLI